MEELAKVAHQMLVDKAMAKKDRWGVHETHCCPDHGCKYGDDDCPVVLGLTEERNESCEMCEYDEEHPDPLSLLEAWIDANATDDYWNTDSPTDRRSIDVDNLISTINSIRRNPRRVRDEGRKEKWWK